MTFRNSSEIDYSKAYRLEYEQDVPDCNGHGMVFRHIKSGARVCVISNDDENKAFSIAFRTTPFDDTGVPHIIEHSVLCGSDKFPPKDPFIELAKGSLNTFLNAMTYPDKTCYPVASCNEQDLNNLMDVYMDAVLHPNIYKHEEIFKQEGWHYELADRESPLTINGVVYSEMKGAFSNPEEKQSRECFRALFTDNTYGFESGGDPKCIPELTYEQFLNFHRRYYHPTNSYILLYGDLNAEERLKWLDEEYLCKYDYQPVDSEVGDQKATGELTIHGTYPIGEEDDDRDAGYLCWTLRVCDYKDQLKNDALQVICDVLFNNPGAPVRDALLKAGIGQDFSCYVGDYLKQSYIQLTVRNTEVSKLDDMKRIIREELEKIVKNGFNKESLLATVNSSEFKYCEADFGEPKGLVYGLNAMNTWLHDDSMAFTVLEKKNRFPVLREKIETGYYEELVKECLLNCDSVVYHAMAPQRGLAAEEEKKLADMLAERKASLSDEELDRLIADTAALKAYQAEMSTPEELATIPMLAREDIAKNTPAIIGVHEDVDGVDTFFHDVETNGIVYMKLLFDADRVPEELIPYISLGIKLFGMMNTSKHSYLELDNSINIHTGGIGMATFIYSLRGLKDTYRPVFGITGSSMAHSFDRLLEFIDEEINETDFSDLTRIRELLGETKARMQSYLPAAGNSTAAGQALAGISSVSEYKNRLSGLKYYRFICELLEADDEGLREAVSRIRTAMALIVGSDNVMLDITCNRKIFDSVKAKAAALAKSFPEVREGDTEGMRVGPTFAAEHKSIGLKTAGEVNFVGLAGRFEGGSCTMEGYMDVAKTILSREYLWNNVRVLGGAYGAGFNIDFVNKVGCFTSYRDPHIAETVETYKKAHEFLRSFDTDERNMTKFVIGTMGRIDSPLSPLGKGDRALALEMTGTTYEMIQEMRNATLSVQPENIRELADIVEQIGSDACTAVVGTESMITKSSELFDEIQNLL